MACTENVACVREGDEGSGNSFKQHLKLRCA